MCMSPKTGEEINNFSLRKKANIIKNYSKKNVTKLSTNKNPFSRNITHKSNKCQQSSRRIIQNPISTNSTSNNSSYKNFTNINNPKNKLSSNVFHHKKAETSFNFMSFLSQNSNPNLFGKNQQYLNNSFFTDLNNKENKSKEIFINKIENKKIYNKNTKSKIKINQNKKNFKDYNITTTKINGKNKDKKIIINLAHSPHNNKIYNNKSLYQSKNISPTTSRNILIAFQGGDINQNIDSIGNLKKIKSPKNSVIDNNSIIKTYYFKKSKEKYNTDTYNKNVSKNKNKNKGGNMFAIHKIYENNLFNNKMKEKNKKTYLNKQISLNKKINGIMGMNRNNSCSNKKIFSNKSSNSVNTASNLLIFSLRQNNSDKNCLYRKNNNSNKKFKGCFSLNHEEHDINNKTYNYNINNKEKDFINVYNINSINKYNNSLYLKIENNNNKKNEINNNNIINNDKENNKNLINSKIKKYISPIQSDSRNFEIYMSNSTENERCTPEETHFQVIAFIQSIKIKNKNYH